jgi:uncharacterized surface protein with fasciclin (FAS1) repeats
LRRKAWLLLSVVFLLCLSAIGGVSAQEATDNIVDLMAKDSRFNSMYDYVIDAGLADTLASAGNTYTVFAPRNQAFAAVKSGGDARSDTVTISDDELYDLLTYHIVPGYFSSENLTDGQTLTTLFGEQLTVRVENDQTFVDDVLITTADIPVKNGVIHIVDDLLVPSTITLPEVEREGSGGKGGGGSSQGNQNQGSPAPVGSPPNPGRPGGRPADSR